MLSRYAIAQAAAARLRGAQRAGQSEHSVRDGGGSEWPRLGQEVSRDAAPVACLPTLARPGPRRRAPSLDARAAARARCTRQARDCALSPRLVPDTPRARPSRGCSQREAQPHRAHCERNRERGVRNRGGGEPFPFPLQPYYHWSRGARRGQAELHHARLPHAMPRAVRGAVQPACRRRALCDQLPRTVSRASCARATEGLPRGCAQSACHVSRRRSPTWWPSCGQPRRTDSICISEPGAQERATLWRSTGQYTQLVKVVWPSRAFFPDTALRRAHKHQVPRDGSLPPRLDVCSHTL